MLQNVPCTIHIFISASALLLLQHNDFIQVKSEAQFTKMMGIICFNPLYYLSILGKSYSNWIFSKPKNVPTSPLVESLSINFVCHHDPIHDGVFVGAALLLLMCTAAAMYYKAMLSFAWYTRTLCSLSQNSNKLFTYIYVYICMLHIYLLQIGCTQWSKFIGNTYDTVWVFTYMSSCYGNMQWHFEIFLMS